MELVAQNWRVKQKGNNDDMTTTFITIVLVLMLAGTILEIPIHSALAALLGAFCGAFTLAHILKEENKFGREEWRKILVSIIGGFFPSAFFVDYYKIESVAAIGMTFFTASFFFLVIIRGAYKIVEKNNQKLISSLVKSKTGIDLEEKPKEPLKSVVRRRRTAKKVSSEEDGQK